jgi:hypothetical protein
MLFSFFSINAQVQDSTIIQDSARVHNPRMAVVFSAVLPGLGQVYNRKYWKVPIIYGAGGAFGYYVVFNQQKYKKFRSANEAYQLDKTLEDPVIDGQPIPNERLEAGMNYYRRYRDLSVLGLGVIYFLNIVDAMIDANFFNYDVSDDLSLKVQPTFLTNPDLTSSIGLRINIEF